MKNEEFKVVIHNKDWLNYWCAFRLHERMQREDFLMKYPADHFPPNGSYEIELISLSNKLKKLNDPNIMHLTGDQEKTPGRYFICFYPASTVEEAKKIAEFWMRYNIMLLETGNTSTEAEVIYAHPINKVEIVPYSI